MGGGSALNVLGLVKQTTKDVDVIDLIRQEGGQLHALKADPLPEYFRAEAIKVAQDLGLPEDWINPGPTSLLDFGLPEGCLDRTETRQYGSRLRVSFIGRLDQIHLKLYAAVDQGGGRHLADLLSLSPKDNELLAAARWAMTHDVSVGFLLSLVSLLGEIGYEQVAEQL